MTDVEPCQVFLNAALDPLDAELGQRDRLRRYRPGGGFRRDLRDVVTAVSPFGHRPVDHARLDGFAEEADLPTPVVDVVLALDVESRGGQNSRRHIANDRATGVAEEQRSGGIGADELDLDFYAAPDLASPPPVHGVRNRRELCLQPGRLEGDVDEPGRRHRGAAERRRERHRRRQLIGDGDRRPAECSGELQRQRHRVVAMGGVLGPLHQHRRQFFGIRRPAGDRADGVTDRLVDDRRRRFRGRRDQGCVPSVTWSVWFLPPR